MYGTYPDYRQHLASLQAYDTFMVIFVAVTLFVHF